MTFNNLYELQQEVREARSRTVSYRFGALVGRIAEYLRTVGNLISEGFYDHYGS